MSATSRAAALALVLASVAGATGVAGCGGEDRPAVRDDARPRVTPAREIARRDRPPPLYDSRGQLLPSDEVIAGLPLPRGLEQRYAEDRTHVYTTRVPLAKVHAYFGPRLVTGTVDRVGDGAIFRGAIPRDARGARIPLDVAVQAVPGGLVRVEVREIPPQPVAPMTEAQYAEQLEQDLRRWR